MAKKERSTLKSYFRTGNIPNQSQYEDLIDSNLNLSDTEEQTILGDLVIQGAVDINNTLEVNSIDTGFGAFEVGQDTRTTDSVTFSGIFSSGSEGNITASGAISASGQVSADNLFLREGSFDIQTGNGYTFNPSSGTGTIDFTVGTNPQTVTASSKLKLASDTNAVEIKGHVTASISSITKTNISASGTIIGNSGSFGSVAGTLSTAAQPNITSLGTLTSVTTGNVTATGNSVLGNAVTDTHTLTGNITSSGNISCSAKITADTLQINGSEVDFTNLPTSDPGVSGRLYNDSGTVKISAG